MRRLRRLLARSISVAKRTLPTGDLTDDLLNYIHGWARLGYVPHVSSPRSFNEHILSNKWRFRGDIELARRLTDKYFFKEWLREKGFDDLVVPTVGLYNSVEEIRNIIFEENTILKPTHLSGWVLPFHESRKLRVDELSKVKKNGLVQTITGKAGRRPTRAFERDLYANNSCCILEMIFPWTTNSSCAADNL